MTRLEKARRELGLSQTKLGIKSGTHPSVISDLERMKRVAWPNLQIKISMSLGLSPDELFSQQGWPLEMEG